jgi:hypothetical protein
MFVKDKKFKGEKTEKGVKIDVKSILLWHCIKSLKCYETLNGQWDNTPLFVKYNPGLLDLLVLLDETGLQTGL